MPNRSVLLPMLAEQLREPCGTCGAVKGERCRSVNGKQTTVHAPRILSARRRAGRPAPEWRESTFHQPTLPGDCVEVCRHDDGEVGLRNRRYGGSLNTLIGPEAWAMFVAGVKAGEFDFGTTALPGEVPDGDRS